MRGIIHAFDQPRCGRVDQHGHEATGAGPGSLPCHRGELVRGVDFCRIHKTLRNTPAMAAGIIDRLWSLDDIVAKIDGMAPAPKVRGPYNKKVA